MSNLLGGHIYHNLSKLNNYFRMRGRVQRIFGENVFEANVKFDESTNFIDKVLRKHLKVYCMIQKLPPNINSLFIGGRWVFNGLFFMK
jgi:hypothetical protein